MENLWAAWRRDFILGPKEPECVFCLQAGESSDREKLVLYRGETAFVIMNKYPYNGGHLLVVPFAHKRNLDELSRVEAAELFDLSIKSVSVIKAAMPADGFNIGMNLGAVAGAGIEEHLHMHIVPRFRGDTSFLAVLGHVKVQSITLDEIYGLLKPGFDRIGEEV
jgi:ATP adenylyltransferase